ncbi:unnamed protein product, partial [Amoebophrya sp. A120]
ASSRGNLKLLEKMKAFCDFVTTTSCTVEEKAPDRPSDSTRRTHLRDTQIGQVATDEDYSVGADDDPQATRNDEDELPGDLPHQNYLEHPFFAETLALPARNGQTALHIVADAATC